MTQKLKRVTYFYRSEEGPIAPHGWRPPKLLTWGITVLAADDAGARLVAAAHVPPYVLDKIEQNITPTVTNIGDNTDITERLSTTRPRGKTRNYPV